MSRRMYECSTCGEVHSSEWRAAMCCDEAAYADTDE